MIHPPTLHQSACGQGPASADTPRRSRAAVNDLETRPVRREGTPAGGVDGVVDEVVDVVVQRGDRCGLRAHPEGRTGRRPGGTRVTVQGCDVRHKSHGGDTTTCGNHPRGGTDLVVVDLTSRPELVHYGVNRLPYRSTRTDLHWRSDGRGAPSVRSGHRTKNQRRVLSLLCVLRTGVPKALAGAEERVATSVVWCRSPLAGGPLRLLLGPRGPGGALDCKTQLDELEPRTGGNRGLGGRLLVGVKGRARPKWIAVHSFGARGRWRYVTPTPLIPRPVSAYPKSGARSVLTRHLPYGGRVFLG